MPSPNPGGSYPYHELDGVAAVSSTDAWAVGFSAPNMQFRRARTIIEHWNGSSWTTVPSPNPGGSSGFSALYGVSAVSSTDVWAVGYYAHNGSRPLVLHWNGARWARVASRSPSFAILDGVAAISSTKALAVGGTPNGLSTFTVHCC